VTELLALLGVADLSLRELVTAIVLVTARMLPIAWLAPYAAPPASPSVVRTAVLLSLVLVTLPLAIAHGTLELSSIGMLLAIGRELTLGMALLVATAVPVVAIEHVGRALDAWVSPAMGQQDPSGQLGRLALAMGAALFVAIGGLRVTIGELAHGLVVLPIGQPLAVGDAQTVALGAGRILAHAMTFAAVLAAPALVALFAAELGIALALRASRLGRLTTEALGVRGGLVIAATLFGLAAALPELPALTRWAIEQARSIGA
jgi:type III secretory pathway component EscT